MALFCSQFFFLPGILFSASSKALIAKKEPTFDMCHWAEIISGFALARSKRIAYR
jgi:hypothetical protein